MGSVMGSCTYSDTLIHQTQDYMQYTKTLSLIRYASQTEVAVAVAFRFWDMASSAAEVSNTDNDDTAAFRSIKPSMHN